VIFELLAPWCVLLPAALCNGRRSRFAAAFFWSIFLFFTLSASRRPYYLLPVLPAAAMLVARAASRLGHLRTLGVGLFSLGILFAPFALVPPSWRPAPYDQLPELPAPAAFVAAWAVSVVALAFAAIRCRHLAAALVVAAFAFEGYLFLFAIPAGEVYRTQRPFALAVRGRLGPGLPNLALYQTFEIVYYLDPPALLPEFGEPEQLHDTKVAWLIARRRDRAALGEGWTEELAEPDQPWDRAEQAGAKLLLLRRSR
jgi:4-amino-4-deoxy-L-arabinose transferase-like glycosyltransferase